MNKIFIETKDGKIWQSEQVILDIIKASQQGKVELDLKNEGPCLRSCGLEQLLDNISDCFGFDKDLYVILTSNQKRSSHYTEIKEKFVELDFVKAKARTLTQFESSLDKKFGMFVSRSNWIRLGLASYLHKCHGASTHMTFHFDPKITYHSQQFGLEEFISKYPEEQHVFEFIRHLPIKQGEYVYPIHWNNGALDLDEYYADIFCDMVCETYFSGQTFFITEKILRPIMFKRPFLIQGPVNFLKNLRLMGFQTFDQWWNESYDSQPEELKYQFLKNTVDYIGQQTSATINMWYNQMQETLDHNYNCLLSLTNKRIATIDFYE